MVGTPAKKRKLNNDSKGSSIATRNLDFFFSKQKQAATISSSTSSRPEPQTLNDGALTDEELARKLQAEWDQEDSRATDRNDNNRENFIKQVADTGNQQDLAENATNEAGSNGEHDAKLEHDDLNTQQKTTQLERRSNNTLTLQSVGSAEETISSNIPFDESPLTFDPSKYVTELQVHWSAERGDASYALLTRCFVLVNSTQSRIKIVDTLVNLLRVLIEGDPSSLLPTVRRPSLFL
jgi:DNA ligase-1